MPSCPTSAADTTHWALADGSDVEVLNVVDDHFRLLVTSRAFGTTKAADVVETFHLGITDHGLPASMLPTTGPSSPPRPAMAAAPWRTSSPAWAWPTSPDLRESRAVPPELKKHLARQPVATTRGQLQDQLDHFASYYNTVRPHRALGRHTPAEAFAARTKLHHIGIGRAHGGVRVLLLVKDLDVDRHRGRRTAPPPHARPDSGLAATWTSLGSSGMSRDNCPGCLATSHGALGGNRTPNLLIRRPRLLTLSQMLRAR